MNDLVNKLNQTLRPLDYDKGVDKDLDSVKNIPAVIIGNMNQSASLAAMRNLKVSIVNTKSTLDVFHLECVTPETLDLHLESLGYSQKDWTYPDPGVTEQFTHVDEFGSRTAMILTGYKTTNVQKVMACLASHMIMWHMCISMRIPIMILEHDALFVKKFDWQQFKRQHIKKLKGTSVVALNNPLGATRKAATYYDKVTRSLEAKEDIVDIPLVDDEKTRTRAPQGLPGNSAYIIYPQAAKELFNLIDVYGLWPNDAIMCNQLLPGLKIAYPFFTQVQGLRSTTTR